MINVHFVSNEELEQIKKSFEKSITNSFEKDFNVDVLLFTLVSILALFSVTGIRLKLPEESNDTYGGNWKKIVIKINSSIMDKLRKKEGNGSLTVSDIISVFFHEASANYIFIQSEDFKPQIKH
jgi:hypothetical protein